MPARVEDPRRGQASGAGARLDSRFRGNDGQKPRVVRGGESFWWRMTRLNTPAERAFFWQGEGSPCEAPFRAAPPQRPSDRVQRLSHRGGLNHSKAVVVAAIGWMVEALIHSALLELKPREPSRNTRGRLPASSIRAVH